MNLRLFIAVAVPPEVRMEMARVQNELRPLAAPEDVRWVKPEQFHLTLKFLGNIPSDSVETVKNSLAEACEGVAPFQLCAKGIGFFPNAHSPRVIWIGIENAQVLLPDLHRRIAGSLAPFVEKSETEKFHAHITLGRFQKFRRHKTERLLPRALSHENHGFGEWHVDEVDLMQSELLASGARHTKLFSARLKIFN